MVVCVIILLLITAGFPEYDAVYFDSPGPNAAFTVPENSPSYDVATFDLVGTTPSAIIKKQEPTNPEFELVLVRFSYILRAPALDFEAERTYTVTIEASDSDDGSTDTQTHTVTVTDINEKPKFTQTTFHASIESRDLYQVVVDINPTDEDTEPPNSAANCTIEDGNDNGYFQIEYNTCLISTDRSLGVGQTFTLTIGLADQGTPPLTADQNAVVTIEVLEKALGQSCSNANECSDLNAACLATSPICTCRDDFFDNNGREIAGTCTDTSLLQVTHIQFYNVANTSMSATWSHSENINFVDEYRLSLRRKDNTDQAVPITAGTHIGGGIWKGLVPGVAYVITVTSINKQTAETERSTHVQKERATKPNKPNGALSSGSDLNAFNGRITLSWPGSSGTVSMYGVTVTQGQFQIDRNFSQSRAYLYSLSFKNGFTYNYAIIAFSEIYLDGIENRKEKSDSYRGTFKTVVTEPGPPTNVICQDHTDEGFRLVWDAPLLPNGFLKGYKIEVYHFLNNSLLRTIDNTSSISTTYTIQGLQPGSYYKFRVFTINEKYTSSYVESIDCATRAEKCDEGFYGQSCAFKCGNCATSPCSFIDGNCTDGCAEGVTGFLCKESLSQDAFSNPVVWAVVGFVAAVVLIGLVIAVVYIRRNRFSCWRTSQNGNKLYRAENAAFDGDAVQDVHQDPLTDESYQDLHIYNEPESPYLEINTGSTSHTQQGTAADVNDGGLQVLYQRLTDIKRETRSVEIEVQKKQLEMEIRQAEMKLSALRKIEVDSGDNVTE